MSTIDFSRGNVNTVQGITKELFELLGVPLDHFRRTPNSRIRSKRLEEILTPLFKEVFGNTNRAYRNLLSRSSPNWRKGLYQGFGDTNPPGMRVTGSLYNALNYQLEVQGVRFVGTLFNFAVSYDPKLAPHFQVYDAGSGPISISPITVFTWANKKFGWGLPNYSSTFQLINARDTVTMPRGDMMPVGQAVYLLGKPVREKGLKSLELRENIAQFVIKALRSRKVRDRWLAIALNTNRGKRT